MVTLKSEERIVCASSLIRLAPGAQDERREETVNALKETELNIGKERTTAAQWRLC
jgi:hypothetical protein